jgi:hypothetical protein
MEENTAKATREYPCIIKSITVNGAQLELDLGFDIYKVEKFKLKEIESISYPQLKMLKAMVGKRMTAIININKVSLMNHDSGVPLNIGLIVKNATTRN